MSLELFDPLVREWFRLRLGEPTEVQQRAWPEIAAGRHLLLSAPTGTGKTLAATLWAIDRLVPGAWGTGAPPLPSPVVSACRTRSSPPPDTPYAAPWPSSAD